MSKQTISININFDAVRADLNNRLRAVVHRVDHGLHALRLVPDEQVVTPEVFFQMHWGPPLIADEQARNDLATWLIGNGLSDGIEALSKFLVELRFYLAIESVVGKPLQKNTTMGEFFAELRASEVRPFEKRNWPARIQKLRDDFGFAVDLSAEIESLNLARNCLTHNNGYVDEKAINDTQSKVFVAKYRALELLAQPPDGDQIVISGPTELKAGTAILVAPMKEKSKSFPLGARIDFDATEFTSIVWTLNRFGNLIVDECVKYFERDSPST